MISTDNLNFVPKFTMTSLPEFPCLIIVILFYFRVLIDLCFNYSKTCLTPPLKIDYTLLSPYLCFISILFRFVLLQGDDTSTKIVSMIRKYHNHKPQTIPMPRRGRASQPSRDTKKGKFSKATSSLFPLKMIAILEWT